MLIYRWILIYLEEKHVDINFHSHQCESIFEFMMWHAHYSTRCRIYIDYAEREKAYLYVRDRHCSLSIWVALSFSLSLSLFLSLFFSFLLSLYLSLAYVQLLDVRSSCQTGMKYEEEREMLISTHRIIINFEILFNLYKSIDNSFDCFFSSLYSILYSKRKLTVYFHKIFIYANT